MRMVGDLVKEEYGHKLPEDVTFIKQNLFLYKGHRFYIMYPCGDFTLRVDR